MPETGRPSIRELLEVPCRLFYRRDESVVDMPVVHHLRKIATAAWAEFSGCFVVV